MSYFKFLNRSPSTTTSYILQSNLHIYVTPCKRGHSISDIGNQESRWERGNPKRGRETEPKKRWERDPPDTQICICEKNMGLQAGRPAGISAAYLIFRCTCYCTNITHIFVWANIFAIVEYVPNCLHIFKNRFYFIFKGPILMNFRW